MKTLQRVILIGIVLITALGIAGYFTIKIAFPPEKIRTLIRQYGSEALGRDVSVKDVSVHIFPNLELAVTELKVANAPGFSAEPAVKLREISLSIDFMSLLRFSPVINEIKLVEPEILYEKSADGRDNFEGLGRRGPSAPEAPGGAAITLPAALALNSFVMENGRVRYRDLQSGREITLGRINQKVSLSLDPKLERVSTHGTLEIAEISVRDSATGISRGNIKVTVRHAADLNLPGETLALKKLEIGFQDVRVEAEGTVAHFKHRPEMHVKVGAHAVNLASFLKEVPTSLSPDIPKLTLRGVADFDAEVSGTLDSGKALPLRVRLAVRDGYAGHKDLPGALENLNLALTLQGDTLNLSRFGFSMAGNPVSLSAMLTSVSAPAPRLQGFHLDGLLDLGKLIPLAQKLGLVDASLRVGGVVQAKADAAGILDPKNPLGLKARGDAELRGITVQSKAFPHPVSLQGRIKVDNDKAGENLSLRIGSSDVAVAGTVSNYLALVLPKSAKGQMAKAKFSVQSSFLNLDELLPGGNRAEKSAAPMVAWPVLPKVDGDVEINLGKTQFMNLAMTGFSLRAKKSAGLVTSDMKGSLYSGGFAATVSADLRDTRNAVLGLKLKVNRVEADDFISRLNDRLPQNNRLMKTLAQSDGTIFGKISLSADLKTHGLPQTLVNGLSGTIAFVLADGRLHETGIVKELSAALGKINSSWAFGDLTFSEFKADLTADNGKLLVKNCHIGSMVGSLTANGTIGFDNSLSLAVENHLPPALSKTAAGAAGAVTSQLARLSGISALGNASLFPMDKEKRVILYFLVGGTLTKPSFALDAPRMASEAVSGVKSSLDEAFQSRKKEAQAMLRSEGDKLQAAAKAKADTLKRAAEEQVNAQKKKAEGEAKQQGKKILKNLGF